MARTDTDEAVARLIGLPDPAQTAADDALLAGFFGAALQVDPGADAALLARVLDAGLAEQAAIVAARQPVAARAALPATRGFAAWLGNLGGWGAITGLASATVAGIWLGFSPPTGLAGLADGVLGTSLSGTASTIDQVDLLPSFETYLTEG